MGTLAEKDQRYMLSLIKESKLLLEELAQMDKKMEADILKQKGELAVWWEKNIESNSVANFAAGEAFDYAREEALEAIYKAVFNTLKGGAIAASAVLAPFRASRQPSYKMAYLDSQFGNVYFAKKKRLEEIHRELFKYMPPSPSSIIQTDRLAIENCWLK